MQHHRKELVLETLEALCSSRIQMSYSLVLALMCKSE